MVAALEAAALVPAPVQSRLAVTEQSRRAWHLALDCHLVRS